MGYRRDRRSYRSGGPDIIGFLVILCFVGIYKFSRAPKIVQYLIIASIALFVVFLIYRFIRKKQATSKHEENKEIIVTSSKTRSVDNYEERSLLTETEKDFYRCLSESLTDYDVVINTKTRLEDLAKVRANTRSEYMRARGYIKSRHIDFILCDRSMNVICGIEVDDESHNDPKAKEIDEFKDDLFNKINKTLFRVKNLNKLKESADYIVESLVKEDKITKLVKDGNKSEEPKESNQQDLNTEQVNDCFLNYLKKEIEGKEITVHKNIKLWNLANAKEESRAVYRNYNENEKSSEIDFVLCGKDMEIICGIDINDTSVISIDEQERNKAKDTVFKIIGKQLYRVVYLNKLEESAKYIIEDLIKGNKIDKKQ